MKQSRKNHTQRAPSNRLRLWIFHPRSPLGSCCLFPQPHEKPSGDEKDDDNCCQNAENIAGHLAFASSRVEEVVGVEALRLECEECQGEVKGEDKDQGGNVEEW